MFARFTQKSQEQSWTFNISENMTFVEVNFQWYCCGQSTLNIDNKFRHNQNDWDHSKRSQFLSASPKLLTSLSVLSVCCILTVCIAWKGAAVIVTELLLAGGDWKLCAGGTDGMGVLEVGNGDCGSLGRGIVAWGKNKCNERSLDNYQAVTEAVNLF